MLFLIGLLARVWDLWDRRGWWCAVDLWWRRRCWMRSGWELWNVGWLQLVNFKLFVFAWIWPESLMIAFDSRLLAENQRNGELPLHIYWRYWYMVSEGVSLFLRLIVRMYQNSWDKLMFVVKVRPLSPHGICNCQFYIWGAVLVVGTCLRR
ncbi:uncharacterized protein LOC121049599 [Rosa chinensis]|uniref:uncharacterized protein LOC121049599 n=1 Tax=Rosa chinensis TaxID=74649 RepID=UPI001AD8DE2F|nr:uncharacterized protein LOC121049599 [Rosa chinensis]